MKKIVCILAFSVFLLGTFAACGKNNGSVGNETTAGKSEVVSGEQEGTAQSSEPDKSEGGTTNRNGITLVTTRETSPNHLTERPTLPERSTVTYTNPEFTHRTTKPHSTATTPVRTTSAQPLVEPSVDYGGIISYTAGGITDSVKIVAHSCALTVNDTVAITLTVETVEKSGSRSTIYIGYTCFDKYGNRLNKTVMPCVVPIADVGAQSKTIVTVPRSAVKVEFVKYS